MKISGWYRTTAARTAQTPARLTAHGTIAGAAGSWVPNGGGCFYLTAEDGRKLTIEMTAEELEEMAAAIDIRRAALARSPR